jgi:hypothetical protein
MYIIISQTHCRYPVCMYTRCKGVFILNKRIYIFSYFVAISFYSSFSSMCMFYRSLFVLLYFFFWGMCCLLFFDLRILTTPFGIFKLILFKCRGIGNTWGKLGETTLDPCAINWLSVYCGTTCLVVYYL